jgi:hypothetical protein
MMMTVEQAVELMIDNGNERTGGGPSPMPPCSPQIPQDLTVARNRAAAVEAGD